MQPLSEINFPERNNEMNQISEELIAGKSIWIWGDIGMGKSAVAREVARQLSLRQDVGFFNGRLASSSNYFPPRSPKCTKSCTAVQVDLNNVSSLRNALQLFSRSLRLDQAGSMNLLFGYPS